MDLLSRLIVRIIHLLPESFVKPFAMRYIAGDKLPDAVRVTRTLNALNTMATIDVLGENAGTRDESLNAARAYEHVLRTIRDHHLNANLSIKLTQLGLLIDSEFCEAQVRNLLALGKSDNNFITIDMEDSSATSATLILYEKLRSQGFDNVGVAIQAYLRRSEEDIRRLMEMKAAIRLCKGAYVEPESVAFHGREEIRQNYLRLLRMLLETKGYVGIATHDDVLVRAAYQYIEAMRLQPLDYEFQMLYGVKNKLREKIVADGHRLRIYVPFGEYWYAYSMRRFKENPRLARTVLLALLRKGS